MNGNPHEGKTRVGGFYSMLQKEMLMFHATFSDWRILLTGAASEDTQSVRESEPWWIWLCDELSYMKQN